MARKKFILCFLLFSTGNAWALENPSFEAPEALYGWRSAIMKEGQEPVIRVVRSEHKRGKQALLIAAKDPADIAISQIVHLPAHSLWRASCWVKTKNLQAKDPTEIGGTLHIRTANNRLVAEATGRQFGTCPWRKIEAIFRVPASGEVNIVLFFIGFGKGTGRVWFDDVQLEEITAESKPGIIGSIKNQNGKIALQDDDKISISLANQYQLNCHTGMVVLADGTRLGPMDLSKAEVVTEESKDRCGSVDRLKISGLIGNGMRVTMTYSLYRDEPVAAIDMSVTNPTNRNMFLYRLIPLWGDPPTAGFGSNFPKYPTSRFLAQPDYWSRYPTSRAFPPEGVVG